MSTTSFEIRHKLRKIFKLFEKNFSFTSKKQFVYIWSSTELHIVKLFTGYNILRSSIQYFSVHTECTISQNSHREKNEAENLYISALIVIKTGV